jgi:hypothetical protein
MKRVIKTFLILTAFAFTQYACYEVVNPDMLSEEGNSEAVGTILLPFNGNFFYRTTTEVKIPITVVENAGYNVESYTVYQQLIRSGDRSDVETIFSGSETTELVIARDQLFANTPIDGVVMNEDSLSPGDRFVWTFDVKLSKFQTLSDLPKALTYTFSCPVNADFTGDYEISDPRGTFNGPVKISSTGATGRTIDLGLLNSFAVSFNLDLLCEEVLVPDQALSGVSCGGDIPLSNLDELATYDPDDDSSLIVRFNWGGSCSGFEGDYELTFTKIE